MNHSKPSMVGPALIGGVFLGVTSGLPIVGGVNCACCALVIAGGVIAAYLYQKDYPAGLPPLSYGDAAVLGLLTGVLGGLVWTVVEVPLTYLQIRFGLGMADVGEVARVLEDADIPPQLRDLLLSFAGSSAAMTAWVVAAQAVMNMMLSVIFAPLGAIIGLAIFRKPAAPPVPPAVQTVPPPPQPPGSEGPPR